MPTVSVIDHPLVGYHLAGLRDVSTHPAQFRHHVRQLAMLLAIPAMADLETTPVEVETPLAKTTEQVIAPRIGLVPILRAGLGMVDPLLDLLPTAEVWHLGLYRDEETATPVHYYSKLELGEPVDLAYVLDPMLATGGSVTAALQSLHEWGCPQTRVLSIIAAQEGIDIVTCQFPDTPLYVCAIDPELNAQKFIVPGLGDAGDRTFNTSW